MKTMSKRILCAAMALTLVACGGASRQADGDAAEPAAKAAKQRKKVDPSHFSGYLVKYDDMQEYTTPTGGTRLAWVSPELQKGQYHSIIIDPVGFYPKLPLYSKVSKGRMLEVSQYLAKRVKQEIGRDLKIVTQPGPGVLRWDAAITGAKPAADATSHTRNLPVAGIFIDASPQAASEGDPGMVVYLESRLIDSQSRKLVAKSVRAGVGTSLSDPNMRITMNEMQPVLDDWVRDAGVFVRERIR